MLIYIHPPTPPTHTHIIKSHTKARAFRDIHPKLLMGSLMMKKVLFLILIVVGSISCSLGVEFERFPSGKGRKEKIACQFIRRAHPKRSRYFACEGVKRNHMNVMGKFSTKYENLLPTGSQKIVDANLRYNQMPRLHKRHIYLGATPSPGSHGSPSHPGPIG